jgi:heme b synthase
MENQGHNTSNAYQLRLVAWELTQACNLACKHCRAQAQTTADPDELSTEEAQDLIELFRETGQPLLIFTGGEPLMREDLFELVSLATHRGLKCVLATNGTMITPGLVDQMLDSGIQRVAISIDGPQADIHNTFRGVPGAFEASMQGIAYLKEKGMPFQLNTTVTKSNMPYFKEIFYLADRLQAVAWHIFLLVPMGRAAGLQEEVMSPQEYEDILHWFYDFRKTTQMHLKATCAPHYHRILRQKARVEGISVNTQNFGLDAVTRGCLGGIGFCFVSHTGQVQPCGYLELDCGQIRQQPFPDIWNNSPIFQELRNPALYRGKCGCCEYHHVCGGCRARALTMKGHYLEEEPLCLYEPKRRS